MCHDHNNIEQWKIIKVRHIETNYQLTIHVELGVLCVIACRLLLLFLLYSFN